MMFIEHQPEGGSFVDSAPVGVTVGDPAITGGCPVGESSENYTNVPENTPIGCTDPVTFSGRFEMHTSNAQSGGFFNFLDGFGIDFDFDQDNYSQPSPPVFYTDHIFRVKIGSGIADTFTNTLAPNADGRNWPYNFTIDILSNGNTELIIYDEFDVELHTFSGNVILSGVESLIWLATAQGVSSVGDCTLVEGFLVGTGLPNPCTGETASITYDLHKDGISTGNPVTTDQLSTVENVTESGTYYYVITDTVDTLVSDDAILTIVPSQMGNLRSESQKTVRRPIGMLKITWTDPLIDVSLMMDVSENNRVSYPEQVADLVTDVPKKWFHTNDPDVILDGTFYPMPSTLAEARKNQVGWWGTTNADENGYFLIDPPTLDINFTKRLVEAFTLTGDNALGEFPVDFKVTVFNKIGENYAAVEEVSVVGNTEMVVTTLFQYQHFNAARLQIEVTRWSAPGKPVKIVEFYSNITIIYESDQIFFLNILQEFESSEGTLPVGNISCNEMDATLQNLTDQFFVGNTDSPIHTLIKRNRKVQPFLGFQYPTGEKEYVAKGLYWTGDFSVSDNGTGASFSARDRFELLRKKDFPWETVFTEILENVSIKTLFTAVLNSAFDYMYDFFYDISDLDDSFVIPHFDPEFFKKKSYFEVIKQLAAASLAYAFMDTPTAQEIEENGPLNKDMLRVLKVETVFPSDPAGALAIDITKRDYIEKTQQADTESMANSITVSYKMFEINPDTEPGEPVEWIDEEFDALAEDPESIIEYGVMEYSYASSDLIQTEGHAQAIADSLLASFTVSARNIEVSTFGDVTWELADQMSIPEYQKNGIDTRGVFATTSLNSQFDGSLRIALSGRKLKEDRSNIVYRMMQDTDGATTLLQETDGATTLLQNAGA